MSSSVTSETDPRVAPAPLQRSEVRGLAVLRRRPEHPRATVVFVHGAMDHASSFARVMRRLGDLDVVAYDRRGYGGSLDSAATDPDPEVFDLPGAGPGADPLERHAADLSAVLNWAAADSPALPTVVVGHSLGGLVALIASSMMPGASGERSAPEVVCVFEAPLPWLDTGHVGSGSRTVEVGRLHGPGAAGEFFYRSMVGDATWDRLSESDRDIRRNQGHALLAELRSARSPRTPLPLPVPPTSLHVGRGSDGPAHLGAAAERLAETAGVPCEVLEGASHGAHMQSSDGFARWVRRAAVGATPCRGTAGGTDDSGADDTGAGS